MDNSGVDDSLCTIACVPKWLGMDREYLWAIVMLLPDGV